MTQRADIPTPALILDLEAFERNLAKMAAHCAANGLALRPHAKTHKSADIAKAQIKAGAVGVCCAKLAEAEALAPEGIEDILLTSPIVTDHSHRRAVALAQKIKRLAVTVDHPDVAARLAETASNAGITLPVLVDLNVGTMRTGILPGQLSTALAQQVDAAPSLIFEGFQAYAGHLMHLATKQERADGNKDAMAQMDVAIKGAQAAGLNPTILTGGGTGTYNIEPETGVLNELQAGSYIFMDKEYGDVAGDEWQDIAFEPALFIDTTVISANNPGFVTTDAGFKSFAMDGPKPALYQGIEGAKYFFMGDEHGGITVPEGMDQLAPGTRFATIVPHCDPTVNLYDTYHCVRGDKLEAEWPVTARGKSQ
ncbi:MAG: threonine aldolase [Haliea sp.]|nr:threonine aldolase [Haliea sp.]